MTRDYQLALRHAELLGAAIILDDEAREVGGCGFPGSWLESWLAADGGGA